MPQGACETPLRCNVGRGLTRAVDHLNTVQCHAWIPLESTKNLEALVPELFWFKVSSGCPPQSTFVDSYADTSHSPPSAHSTPRNAMAAHASPATLIATSTTRSIASCSRAKPPPASTETDT